MCFCWFCYVSLNIPLMHGYKVGRGSSVGTTTRYGLDGPVIEPRWGDILRTCLDRLWGLPSLLHSGYLVFPGGKAALTLTTHLI
jgi:hypothetical protein